MPFGGEVLSMYTATCPNRPAAEAFCDWWEEGKMYESILTHRS